MKLCLALGLLYDEVSNGGLFTQWGKTNNVSRLNGMTGWMVRKFISIAADVVLKLYKTLISPQIDYFTKTCASEKKKSVLWSII